MRDLHAMTRSEARAIVARTRCRYCNAMMILIDEYMVCERGCCRMIVPDHHVRVALRRIRRENFVPGL